MGRPSPEGTYSPQSPSARAARVLSRKSSNVREEAEALHRPTRGPGWFFPGLESVAVAEAILLVPAEMFCDQGSTCSCPTKNRTRRKNQHAPVQTSCRSSGDGKIVAVIVVVAAAAAIRRDC